MRFHIDIFLAGNSVFSEHFEKDIRPLLDGKTIIAKNKISPKRLFKRLRDLITKECVTYYDIDRTFAENGEVIRTKITIDGEEY